MNALAHAAGPAVAPPVVHRVLASPGRPLDVSVRAEMEPRFRHSFADVRVHADGQAARSADAVAAHAYTVGRNVVFAAGRYAPSSAGGKTLIAHELAHVVQQRGAPAPSSRLEIGAADDAAEREADAAAEGRGMARAGTGGGAMLRRRPGYLVSHTFLGWNCGGGVNRVMRQRLVDVENRLRGIFTALPPAARVNPITGAPATTLRDWSGIRQPHGCWRPNASYHSSGSACDVNYDTNPYIATRSEVPTRRGGTTTVYGGEAAGAGLRAERRAAADVYDRATAFVNGTGAVADVSERHPPTPGRPAGTPSTRPLFGGGMRHGPGIPGRDRGLGGRPEIRDEWPREMRRGARPLSYRDATEYSECLRLMRPQNRAWCGQVVLGDPPPPAPAVPPTPRESTAEVYRRFRSASDALRDYLQHAFRAPDPANDHVRRRPVANPETASEADLLRAIPLTERLPETDAIDALRLLLATPAFQAAHPGWTLDARELYFRMLRDYELVRVPMVYGAPEARPPDTRNPALGFVDLRQELVEAMVDVGRLRWGASDFGAAESGDVQHFDLGSHGGYVPGP